jgi:serine protease SohB
MTDLISQYALFLIKAITILALVMIPILTISQNKQKQTPTKIKTIRLNDRYHNYQMTLLKAVADKKAIKAAQKQFKNQQKERLKSPPKNQVFVIHFHGDIMGSTVQQLSEMITAIIPLADQIHEVIVHIESTGGMVHAYGLAALQLQRLRQHNIHLTVCIDKVAASGGYMMAVLADQLIAAPFALIGSIGVVAEIPNFHRLLKKHAIDYEQISAGEFKRTLSTLGEITSKGRNKMQKDINQAHELFKQHVKTYRPQLDIDQVATGELWFGHDALKKQLVDKLMSSHDYIYHSCQQHTVILLEMHQKKNLKHKLLNATQQTINHVKYTLAQQSQDDEIMR